MGALISAGRSGRVPAHAPAAPSQHPSRRPSARAPVRRLRRGSLGLRYPRRLGLEAGPTSVHGSAAAARVAGSRRGAARQAGGWLCARPLQCGASVRRIRVGSDRIRVGSVRIRVGSDMNPFPAASASLPASESLSLSIRCIPARLHPSLSLDPILSLYLSLWCIRGPSRFISESVHIRVGPHPSRFISESVHIRVGSYPNRGPPRPPATPTHTLACRDLCVRGVRGEGEGGKGREGKRRGRGGGGGGSASGADPGDARQRLCGGCFRACVRACVRVCLWVRE